jgi:hypothetical protein
MQPSALCATKGCDVNVLLTIEKWSSQNQSTKDDSSQKQTAECIGIRRGHVQQQRGESSATSPRKAGFIQCEQSIKVAGALMDRARTILAGQRGFHWDS